MTERKKYKELREAGRMLIERLWGEGEKMSVYVDELPDSCYDCCCNNDDWKCRLTDSELPCKWDVRNDDCPLKVVVHCKNCKWYDPPHIEYKDGTREDYPKEPFVTADIGVTVGGICIAKNKIYCTAHDRENPDDYEEIVIFRNPDDYCSYGERREDG